MAQFWIVFFFILLAVAELYQSVKDITLPFPIYLLLGAVLAVASNYRHQNLLTQQPQQVVLTEIVEPNPVLLAADSPQLVGGSEDRGSKIVDSEL